MNKEKRILILVWNLDIGGIQKRILNTVTYLNKHHPKIKVDILLKNKYPTPILEKVNQLENVAIHSLVNKKNKPPRLSTLKFFIALIRLKPTVILTFLDRLSIKMALLSKLIFWKKFKLVLNESNYTPLYIKFYGFPLLHKLVQWFYPLADKIITPTQAIKNVLKKRYQIPSQLISVIPHWIVDTKTEQQTKKYDFIYIGRLEEEKNIFWLIDTIKEIKKENPGVNLCVVGKGTHQEKFINKISKNDLEKNIVFKGFQKNVSNFLAQTKIILLPSLTEGMPNVVLEGYCHQVPAVVNNFPGADEVVFNNQTGFIADSKKEFINFCKKLVADNNLRKTLGMQSKKVCKNKFSKKNLKKFVEVLID